MTISTEKGEIAAGNAEAGALVIPLHTPTPDRPRPCSCNRADCEHIGKHPRTMQGLLDATSCVQTVTRWWAMWPDANIGIRPHLGVVVLDVDTRHGGGGDLLALQEHYAPLPRTQTVRTGSGGLHIWLAYDGPVKGKLSRGIDVKCNSGYLVMPPSTHESGRQYEWLNDQDGIQPAPRWLIELLTPATIPLTFDSNANRATPGRAQAWLRVVQEAQEGERNARLFWACCRAAECGLDPAPFIAAAVTIGLAEREATATARSAARSVRGAA